MKSERTRYRVVKTLAPADRGAIALARTYGDSLVCVRHRTDAQGKVRHTTVELLVESTPIRPRSTITVSVKVQPHERSLQAMIKTAGGVWDSRSQTWSLPSRVATILNLRNRVVGIR